MKAPERIRLFSGSSMPIECSTGIPSPHWMAHLPLRQRRIDLRGIARIQQE